MIRGIGQWALCVLAGLPALAAGGLLHDPSVGSAASAAVPLKGSADYAHVARILQSQCASCHNPQGGAPFNLLTYEDAKQWGGQILDVTQSRYMPPWLPAPGKGDFAGARRLTDAELDTLRTWVGAGMPGGPASPDAPPPAAGGEWSLGKPDAVLQLEQPVKLRGNGPDTFVQLVLPAGVHESRTVRAVEIRPSDPQALRGAVISFDTNGSRTAQHDPQNAATTHDATMEPPEPSALDSSGLVFWQSGSPALKPRPGQLWELSPAGTLILTAHLKTTGRKQDVQIQVGLYFNPASAPAASKASALVLRLNHQGAIELAATNANTRLEDSYTLPQAAQLTAIYPRAHFLARSVDAYATLPGGGQVPLLSIPKWDVDWLEVYCYRKPVSLPAGSVVHWSYVYDNSAGNPHNPSDPPETAHAGNGPKDEVNALMLELLPPTGADAVAWRKAMTDQGAQQAAK